MRDILAYQERIIDIKTKKANRLVSFLYNFINYIYRNVKKKWILITFRITLINIRIVLIK